MRALLLLTFLAVNGICEASEGALMPLVTLTHSGTWYGKPPLKRLDLDASVRNPGPKVRWMFLAGHAEPGTGGVDGVVVYELPGAPATWLWHLEGPGGGWAVRLPPRGEATLRGLAVEAWVGQLPPSMSFAPVVADELLIGGVPMERWSGVKAEGLAAGDHDARIDRMKSKSAGFHQNPRDAKGLSVESPLTFAGALTSLAVCELLADPTSRKPSAKAATPWPDLRALLGRTITLEGQALNARSGALLSEGKREIWIDLDGWPAGYSQGGDRGKRVRVTGTVVERADLPVFVEKKGELPKSGIPVPEGTDLEKAARRYLLQDPTWTLLE